MKRLALFLLLLSAGPMARAAPPDLPTRAQMEEVMEESDNICRYISSLPPSFCSTTVPRREIRSLRCHADPTPEVPMRILCRFSGVRRWSAEAREFAFGPECVRLRQLNVALWRVEAFIDADKCA